MNERIHELISGYLHGGNTPAEEKELFDACGSNPETAELLRQHLMLSLRLRSLREQTTVPQDLGNAVLLRINELQAEREAANPAPVPMREAAEPPVRRFGWVHLFGASLATASLAALLVFLVPDSDAPIAMVEGGRDTVTVVRADTVTQVREISTPVYIVRNVPAPAGTQRASDPTQMQAEEVAEAITPLEDQQVREFPIQSALADVITSGQREARVLHFLEQYNSMLATVESVQLSSKDRVTQ